LLVTCQSRDKLVELSAESGQCVHEIVLQAAVCLPWHGIQLTTGQYVVSHGRKYSLSHRVCIVDDDGRVIRSYGGKCENGQMNWPRQVAVDKDSQFIFVADHENSRVVLLTPTLQFVCHISEGISRPYSLHFNDAKRRLYVGEWARHSSVVVIQL